MSCCLRSPRRRAPAHRFIGALAVFLAAASGAQTAHSAPSAQSTQYDLCVRGTTLEETRNARLKLTVDGADVASIAPRLGAVLANRQFWGQRADKVYGAPFDADLCGAAVAEELTLAITLTDEQASALAAESTRGSGSGSALMAAVDRVLGKATPAQPEVGAQLGTNAAAGAGHGEQMRDAAGNLLYNVLQVYYATDRQETKDPSPEEHFNGERGNGQQLSLGVVEVTVPKSHRVGQLESPSLLRLEFKADPKKHMTLKSLEVLDPDAWRAQIAKRARALDNPGVLVFIHGYNCSFAEAASRAGQLAYDLNFAGATVLFSWPSRAALTEYTFDEQSAEWANSDMKTFLGAIASVAPGTPVYVIAHSMGNRVLTRGFKALLDEDITKRRAFKQIVLAAPDIDADVFRREIAPSILGRGPRVTLYASSNDKALAASRAAHGGYRRLGDGGKDIVVMQDLDTVDASTVSTEFLGHSYFGSSGTVVDDLKYIIHESLGPQQREQFALEPVRDVVLGLYWRFKGH